MNVAGQASYTPIRVSDCRLSDDLGGLLDREQFCDVVLSVDGCEFHAHKAILAGQWWPLVHSDLGKEFDSV